MVLELMERDMRSFLRTDARMASLQSRVSLGLGALSGILYLHSQVPPVVHRDIKPENLLLSHGDSRVKVCDLGLARNKHGVFLQTVHQGGTLSYVAPEVHRGSDVDERCDMYALAVVLWELVTLGVPFADKPPQSIPGIVGTHSQKSALQWFDIVNILGHSLRRILSIPGTVGWGAERPCMKNFAAVQEQLDGREAAALPTLATWIAKCWAQVCLILFNFYVFLRFAPPSEGQTRVSEDLVFEHGDNSCSPLALAPPFESLHRIRWRGSAAQRHTRH
jgi:serine/threonine protein kinase